MGFSLQSDQEDPVFAIARVAQSNGYAVIVCDQVVSRLTKYHGCLRPGDKSWWFTDSFTEAVDRCVDSGYHRITLATRRRDDTIVVWDAEFITRSVGAH